MPASSSAPQTGSPISRIEGVQHDELVRRELEELCSSAAFQSSRKSCEFLRFIVQRALEGTTDGLKERVIAVELFQRDSAYDAGSDSVVRVRANEVRRRLRAHYEGKAGPFPVQIDVPVGSYVPRFAFASILEEQRKIVTAAAPWHEAEAREKQAYLKAEEQDWRPLNLSVLAPPAILALFLCAICIRWHFLPHDPTTIMWNLLLSGRTTMVIDGTNAENSLRVLPPLLTVAARYGVTPIFGSARDAASYGSSALYISVLVDRSRAGAAISSDAAPTSSLSIHCGVPCQLIVHSQTFSAAQDLLDQLSNPRRTFPLKLATSVEDYSVLRQIRGGGLFSCNLPGTHEITAVNQYADGR